MRRDCLYELQRGGLGSLCCRRRAVVLGIRGLLSDTHSHWIAEPGTESLKKQSCNFSSSLICGAPAPEASVLAAPTLPTVRVIVGADNCQNQLKAGSRGHSGNNSFLWKTGSDFRASSSRTSDPFHACGYSLSVSALQITPQTQYIIVFP